MPATTAETLSLVTRHVSVAPLVLLSVADHYGRSAKDTRKRVVGVLLGQNDGKKNVRVSNSFAGMYSLSVCLFVCIWMRDGVDGDLLLRGFFVAVYIFVTLS